MMNLELFAYIYIVSILLCAVMTLRKKSYTIFLVMLFLINYTMISYLNNCHILENSFKAISMFIGALDYNEIHDLVKESMCIKDFLNIIVPFQFLISVLYSIAFTVNYFSFFVDYCFYIIFKHEVYVFSCLNKESIALANSIKQKLNYKFFTGFLFCNVDYKKDIPSEFINDIEKMNALLTSKDVRHIYYSKNKKYKIFLSSGDDYKNINDLEKIIKNEKLNCDKTIIYPFIKLLKNEIFLDVYLNSKFQIHAVNEVSLMVNDVLFKKPVLPLNNSKELNILIIGSGIIGKQFLKSVYWCTTMCDINVNITLLSNNINNAVSILKQECPEIFNKRNYRWNNTYKIRQNKTIKFKQINVNSYIFDNYINKNYNYFHYYFVALGSDRLNADVSINIRHLLSTKDLNQKNIIPISTIIMDDTLSLELSNISVNGNNNEDKKIKYNINCFGSYTDIYSYEKIINNSIFKLGLTVSGIIKGKDEENRIKNDYQCNYRSSMAFVLSIKYKLYFLNNKYDLVKKVSNIKDEEFNKIKNASQYKNQLSENEHERWRCFYETEGFQSVTDEDIDKYKEIFGLNNYMAKLHPALCDVKELQRRKEKYKTNYIENDEKLINEIGKIIKEGNLVIVEK